MTFTRLTINIPDSASLISVLWAVFITAAYHIIIIIIMKIYSVVSALLLVSSMVMSAPAPAPGSILDKLFKDAPLLGPLGGLGAGGLLTAALGYKTKDSILNTINTLANVAEAKIGLLNLGTNLVDTGINAVEKIRGEPQYQPQYHQYRPAYPRYSRYG